MHPKRIAANGGNSALWINWLEDAKLDVSQHYVTNLNKAQRSLRDHPVPIDNPDDLYQLKFFGPAIIKKIKDRARKERLPSRDDIPVATASGGQFPSGPPLNRSSTNKRPGRLSINETTELINGPIPVLAGIYEPTYLAPEYPLPHNPRFHQPEQAARLPDCLCFTYCDQAQKSVPLQSEAAVEVHEQHGILLYAIIFRADHLPLAQAAGVLRLQPARSEQFTDIPQTYHGFLPETNQLAARLQSSVLPPPQGRNNRTTDPLRTLPSHASKLTGAISSSTPRPVQRSGSTSSAPVAPVRPAPVGSLPFRNESSVSDGDEPTGDIHMDSATAEQFQQRPRAVSIDFPLIKWPARTYDIICLIDTREIRNAAAREYIAEELAKRNVQVERRSLALGDMLWMARRRPAYRQQDITNGITDSGEVVLDFMVERKRLDDLIASIKDGRFHEQKFRMKNSGIANLFYVVEIAGKGRSKDAKTFEDGINTAISSTQVVDEIFVYQTEDTEATVELLKTLHDSVCDKYKSEDILVIPPMEIHRDTYTTLQQDLHKRRPHASILTLYESFNLVNAKTTFQTARECFARQLLCIKGMSPERASFVVERYGTLRGLWEAFRQAEIEEGIQLAREADDFATRGKKGKGKSRVQKAELMLADVGKGRRRVGNELSKNVYHLVTDDVYGDSDGESD